MREQKLDNVLPVPWLKEIPKIIQLKEGRQLFVDDYLIEQTDLKREYLQPEITDQPVLFPQTKREMNDGFCPVACPFKDGLFYDEADHKYKLWYNAGWFDGTSYAESDDGFEWKRVAQCHPEVAESLVEREPDELRDGACVWIDYHAQPEEKYKMLLYFRRFDRPIHYFHEMKERKLLDEYAKLYRSSDGLNWEFVCKTGLCGDNTNFFYNPFRRKWVYSIRKTSDLQQGTRIRAYYETEHFFDGAQWKDEDPVFWSHSDCLDEPDENYGYIPQLYNLDVSPYESLMIGCFGIFLGPPNPICEKTGIPKTIDMKIGFSRDGFHFYRPDRRAFIPSSRIKDHWNYGYIHPVNGGFVVNGDEMRLYFSTFSGNSPVFGKHMYAGGSVGVARMRRDGFAAMGEKDSCGSLLTRPLLFEEGSLYVNAEAADGWLGAEIIDAQSGKPLAGYELENCLCISGNGTKQKIIWKTQATVPASETGLQIRFVLDHSRLYAFWFSNSPTGASKGYFGAGGPGLTKAQDL